MPIVPGPGSGQTKHLFNPLIMSVYRAPSFIHPFQYSLMQHLLPSQADIWLKAHTAGA